MVHESKLDKKTRSNIELNEIGVYLKERLNTLEKANTQFSRDKIIAEIDENH